MTKRITVVMMTVALCAGAAMAEDPYQVAWTVQIGTASDDYSHSVTVDAAGNVYISGMTRGNIGGTNAGNWDAFVIKFDTSGNELWSQQIGTATGDSSYSVAVDAAGNAYISGSTYGDLGGASAGGKDAFLTKFDSSGNEVWRRQIGTLDYDTSEAVAVDAAGNAYISGWTAGDLGGANAGETDAFLTKFDSAGNELWSRQIGSSSSDASYSVAVDVAGNAYISGTTHGDLGGASAGGRDAFLIKFDSSGGELWRQQIGSASADSSFSVAVDVAGNAYISGETQGDLGGGTGGVNAFLTKFDTSGNELWSQQIGTSDVDWSYSVAVDVAGNAYISGKAGGDLGGVQAGKGDAFLTKFDTLGNELWSQQIGTRWTDYSYSVAVDAIGNAYITGITTGDLGGAHVGGVDAFLVKFENPNPIPEPTTMSLLAMGACLPLFRRKTRQGLAMLRRRKSQIRRGGK